MLAVLRNVKTGPGRRMPSNLREALARIFHTPHGGRDAALRRPRAVQARNVRPSAGHQARDNARCSAAARGGDGAARRPYLSWRAKMGQTRV